MEITRDSHQHPLLDAVANIAGELDKAATFNPTFVPTTDKAVALRELSAIVTRAQGLLVSVLAVSGDVADEAGARSAGDWYAAATRLDHKPAKGLDRLARSLDQHYPHLRAAVLDGRVNLDQAHVIAHALDDLPADDITLAVRERAELHLIDLADDWAPTPLRRLARKVLEVVAPEVSDEAERKALEREEQLAAEHTRLTLTPLGDRHHPPQRPPSRRVRSTAPDVPRSVRLSSPYRHRVGRRTHPHPETPRLGSRRPPGSPACRRPSRPRRDRDHRDCAPRPRPAHI